VQKKGTKMKCPTNNILRKFFRLQIGSDEKNGKIVAHLKSCAKCKAKLKPVEKHVEPRLASITRGLEPGCLSLSYINRYTIGKSRGLEKINTEAHLKVCDSCRAIVSLTKEFLKNSDLSEKAFRTKFDDFLDGLGN
jgi:hypothetical protein